MTLYQLAQRFVGEVLERPGDEEEPFIQWCHSSCGMSPDTPDSVPWCSSFINRLAWLLRLPRSKSAAARSWLTVGVSVTLTQAAAGDVVILKRGDGVQPGPEVTSGASGHVGLFAGVGADATQVLILGGNQANGVSVAGFPQSSILGIRRLTT